MIDAPNRTRVAFGAALDLASPDRRVAVPDFSIETMLALQRIKSASHLPYMTINPIEQSFGLVRFLAASVGQTMAFPAAKISRPRLSVPRGCSQVPG